MTETHIIETDEGIVREFEVPEPRYSALFAWPVILLDTQEQIPNLHCTAAYIRDVRTWTNFDEPPVGFIHKDEFLGVRGDREAIGAGVYRLAKVTGVDAFGSEQDVPVLRVEIEGWKNSLETYHKGLVEFFNDIRVGYASDFPYSAHVTVPLKVLVDPPKQVVLGPMELWYCDDEPVVI